uniref:AT13310p n=1 Tax=Drosophila melanogaster TaxID=7227 RepID=Q8T904_DROME|nr:AT13310p [Drosophila melanogaster]
MSMGFPGYLGVMTPAAGHQAPSHRDRLKIICQQWGIAQIADVLHGFPIHRHLPSMCALQFQKITILITTFCEILATAAVWALRQPAASWNGIPP